MNSAFTKVETHSIAWVRARAAFWGMSPDHDLDEPVRLTDEVPVRVRLVDRVPVIDRKAIFKVARSGYRALLRLTFQNGTFVEHEVPGVNAIDISISTVQVSPR